MVRRSFVLPSRFLAMHLRLIIGCSLGEYKRVRQDQPGVALIHPQVALPEVCRLVPVYGRYVWHAGFLAICQCYHLTNSDFFWKAGDFSDIYCVRGSGGAAYCRLGIFTLSKRAAQFVRVYCRRRMLPYRWYADLFSLCIVGLRSLGI